MSYREKGGRNAYDTGGRSSDARERIEGGGNSNMPPPGLRGREIGLWFARRNRERWKANNEYQLIPRVHLESALQRKTENALVRVEEVLIRRNNSNWSDGHKRIVSACDGNKLGEVNALAPRVKEPKRANCALGDVRRTLPVFSRRHDILRAINENQVCVISGETGSGKSTQVPQYIIEQCEEQSAQKQRQNLHTEGTKGIQRTFVVCTQPRRISAISVAERVAKERGEVVGGHSVGYQIRFENRAAPVTPDQPVILYCTTGIVFQYLQSDPMLSYVSHLIVDEVHERSLHSDLLLTIIKEKILPNRPDFRLICMSATLDSNTFVEYFGPACVHLGISGRLYPVEDIYLEDYVLDLKPRCPYGNSFESEKNWQAKRERRNQLLDYGYSRDIVSAILNVSLKTTLIDPEFVVAAVKWICKQANEENATREDPADSAILVFLPGWDVISDVCVALKNVDTTYLNRGNSLILPLHSMLPPSEQAKVFLHPPRGVRKIILSTMIAEASVTIDDVVYVVDCGKTKLTTIEVDKNNQSRFGERWVSQANAKQRMGRAGRVRPGKCYKLYTRMDYEAMDEFQQPEMARTRLENIVLYIKELQLGPPEDFLPKCITPPEREAVMNSVRFLEQIGALEPDNGGRITVLGKRICALSIEPRLAKLLLIACLFGDKCLQPALSMAACLDFKDPFFTPMGEEHLVDKSRRNFAQMSGATLEFSDHVMLANAVQNSHQKSYYYLRENFLSSQTLKMIFISREQFQHQLSQLGVLPPAGSKGPGKTKVGQGTLRAVICGGLYPGIARANFKLSDIPRLGPDQITLCKDNTLYSLSTETAHRAQFHPKSVLGKQRHGLPSALFAHYLAQHSDTSRCVNLYEVTPVDHLPLLVFASAGECVYNSERETFKVNGWLELSCEPDLAHFIRRLRAAFNFAFETYLIAGSMSSDGPVRDEMSRCRDLLDALVVLFENTRSAEMITKCVVPGAGDRTSANVDDDEDDA